MGAIVSIHSFRGGTGKSNLTANLGVALAAAGKRVAIVDSDVQSPGIYVLFGLDTRNSEYTLNRYLRGECAIEEAAVDVGSRLTNEEGGPLISEGALYLVPSSGSLAEIARILKGYDYKLLNKGYKALVESLRLDALLIDTHPGLNEETLLSMAVSDVLVLVLRPDRQDFQGTAVTVEVARKLSVPKMYLVVNKLLSSLDPDDVKAQVTQTYKTPVAGVIPFSMSLARLASSGVFLAREPSHPVSRELKDIAEKILSL